MRPDILKIADIFNRPRKIAFEDIVLIQGLKKKYMHTVREFYHGSKRYSVDCLYCHAVPGTIETSIIQLVELLKKDNNRNRLLNLGGGTGQVSNMLTELGFDVINVDIEVKVEDPKNIRLDLNSDQDFPFKKEFFDFVFCQEVIEHIENPWKLLRRINETLKDNAFLLLTMPNIQSTHSKKIFTKKGYFHWFTPDCFSYHINPLPVWEIELIAQKTGFVLKELRGNGEYYFQQNNSNQKEIINKNECLIFLLQKNKS